MYIIRRFYTSTEHIALTFTHIYSRTGLVCQVPVRPDEFSARIGQSWRRLPLSGAIYVIARGSVAPHPHPTDWQNHTFEQQRDQGSE
jgi:hypothetical protein